MERKKLKISFIAVIIILVILIVITILGGILFFRNTPALSSKHFSIDRKMLSYYINFKKQEYIKYYKENYGDEYFKTVKFDINKPLDKQDSCYGGTWYDYFYKEATNDLTKDLTYCEAALSQNLELTKKEKQETINKLTISTANKESLSIDKLSLICGLSDKYQKEFLKEIKFEDKQLKKFYESNKNEFDCVDYKYIEINAEYDYSNSTNEEFVNAMNKAEDIANTLVSDISNKGFDNIIEKYIKENGINKSVDQMLVKNYRFENSTQFGNWAFSNNRKQGDVVVFRGRGVYSIYFIVKPAYPLDYTIRKIQRISLINKKDKIYDLYDEFNKMENTDNNFIFLAKNNGQSGEIIEAWKEKESQELNNWLYSDKRVNGDCFILNYNNGLSLVRFCGEGDSFFTTKLKKLYLEKQMEEHFNNLKNRESLSIVGANQKK